MAILGHIKQLSKHLRTFHTHTREQSVVISEYLDPSLVIFLSETTRDKAIHRLVEALYKHGRIHDILSFYEAVLDREHIVSTGVGMNVAIPHAKLETYEDFFIAIGVKTDQGIEWNSIDKMPVKLIFLIGGPSRDQTKYLKILSRLTAAIKDENLRKKIMKACDPNEIIQLIQSYDQKDNH